MSLKLPPLPSLAPLPKVEEKKKEDVKESSLPSLPISLPSLPPLTPSPKSITIKKGLKVAPAFVPKSEIKTEVKKDPREYIDTFFGVRNGIQGKPVENQNYTLETLTYMTSHNRADEMTKIIVEEMQTLGYSSFELWENTSGIGGNTLSFADNPNIKHVTAFEILPDRREMLRNNIKMYNLLNKVNILEKEFKIEDIPCGSVLFMDPEWLVGKKGHEATKKDYVLEGLKVANKTLEDWVSGCNQCVLVALKVPPGYKLKPVPNFDIKEVLLKNTLLLILRNQQKVCPTDINKNVEKIKQQEQREKEEYLIWRQDLKNFLRNEMLPRVTSSKDALDKLVSDEAMETWEVAFTHESFDPNMGRNYEELEILGDSVFANCYLRFIMSSYPEFNRSQLAELKTKFLSNEIQSQISRSIGLGKFVRTNRHVSIHVWEDILESFCGALEIISDKIFKFSSGFGLCYNLTVSLYQDLPIEYVDTLAHPKTQVKEVMERLQIISPKLKEKVPESFEEDGKGNIIFTISLPSKGIPILKSLGFNINNPILSQASDRTKKVASIKAYRMALKTLNEIGVTRDFVEQIVQKRDLTNPELAPYINSIQQRLKLEGFVSFYLNEYHEQSKMDSSKKKFIQLIGVKPDGEKKILAMSSESVESVITGKQQVLSAYANYQS